MADQAAELAFLFKQRDLVSTVAELHGRLHTGRAAADDGHLLAGAGLLHQHIQPVLNAQLGVDGADGVVGIVGIAAVALVTPQAGNVIDQSAFLTVRSRSSPA